MLMLLKFYMMFFILKGSFKNSVLHHSEPCLPAGRLVLESDNEHFKDADSPGH